MKAKNIKGNPSIKKIDYLSLTAKQIDYYFKLFSNLVKKGDWKLELNNDSLEFVEGYISSAHKTLKVTKKGNFSDYVIDLNIYNGKGKAWYSQFLIAAAGSFISKLWLKERGGKISKRNFSGIKNATIVATKNGGVFSP